MKTYSFTMLAIMVSAAATAQEATPIAPDPLTHPFTDTQVTNLFIRGIKTMGDDRIFSVAHASAPTRVYFLKIGDRIGTYTVSKAMGADNDLELYLAKTNGTAIIRAHSQSDTYKNGAEQSGGAYFLPAAGKKSAHP